ncbi:hypothetical protein JOE49_004676 [Paenibacillus sp. PvR133]|jgi:hypothetical protein|nr:hypothetical protein [Paenibacillus sp. PvR133]
MNKKLINKIINFAFTNTLYLVMVTSMIFENKKIQSPSIWGQLDGKIGVLYTFVLKSFVK